MKRNTHNDDQSVNWDASTWQQWLEERLNRRMGTFINEPEEMIAAYDRERSSIENYRGREILELIQNADDEGIDTRGNKVFIRFWPEGVCVANTGRPFSVGGLDSLIVSNLSPKQLDRSRYIGIHGLGFRSVLGWSNCPFILSGDLQIGFSPSTAKIKLNAIIKQNERVRLKVKQWERSGHNIPIPILSCPEFLQSKKLPKFAKSQRWQLMWKRALNLRSTYDTVVTLPFTEFKAKTRALRQIEGLRKELFLFLQHLISLETKTTNIHSTWMAKRKKKYVNLYMDGFDSAPEKWSMHSKTGIIPSKYLTEGKREKSAYEIKIASHENADVEGILYNYFPTKIRIPYPVVIHATMELMDNRQNLRKTDANRYIVKVLAETLTEVAEQRSNKKDPWAAMTLLDSRDIGLDPILEDLDFEDHLFRSARGKMIVPRRDGKFSKPERLWSMPSEIDDWIPLKYFADIVKWTDDYQLRNLITRLQIENIPTDEFRSRLIKLVANISISKRARLIAWIIKNSHLELITENPPLEVIIDQDGEVIDSQTASYLTRSTDIRYNLPPWMSVRFISNKLVEKIRDLLDYTRENLVIELREVGYKNVHQYEFRGIMRAIVSQTKLRYIEKPKSERKFRLEGLKALKVQWLAAGGLDAPKREENLIVELPTRAGEWIKAEELYLGDPYSKGQLMEYLLGSLAHDNFVDNPVIFGKSEKKEEWGSFFIWLGVANLPRTITIECNSWNDKEYLDYVRNTIKYPLSFGEFKVQVPEDLSLNSIRITSFDHMDEILSDVDAHVILSWVMKDDRLRTFLEEDDPNGELSANFRSYTNRTSIQPVPSHARWKLFESSWLPTSATENRPPVECILTRVVGEELQKIFPNPKLDKHSEIFRKFDINPGSIRAALVLIGVNLTIEDISWDKCYDLMMNLPTIDPDGDLATRFYRLINEKNKDGDERLLARERKRLFKATGQLWSSNKGKRSYVSISEGVYFPGDSTIPRAIIDDFHMISLPKGRGLAKISDVFGVKILRSKDIEIEIDEYVETSHQEVLNDELMKLKAYVLAVRLDATIDVIGLSRFKNLKIITCSSIKGRAKVNDTKILINLVEEGDSLTIYDQSYLVVPSNIAEPILGNTVISLGIANILSDILNVERASEFANLANSLSQNTSLKVLSDILGHPANDILAQAKEELQIEFEAAADSEPIWADFSEPEELSDDDESESDIDYEPLNPDEEDPPLPDDISTLENNRKPQRSRRAVKRKIVRLKKSKGSRVQKSRRVTDGDRCEELAELFEQHQKRFPLRVGNLQGDEGYGCDILSFSTRSSRDRFIKRKGKDLNLVSRFIEVKGRSTKKGTIQLKGNQLDKARRFKMKYFLYRVYESIAGEEWEIVELPDPMDFTWPMSYEVDPFQNPSTKYWTVNAVSLNK